MGLSQFVESRLMLRVEIFNGSGENRGILRRKLRGFGRKVLLESSDLGLVSLRFRFESKRVFSLEGLEGRCVSCCKTGKAGGECLLNLGADLLHRLVVFGSELCDCERVLVCDTSEEILVLASRGSESFIVSEGQGSDRLLVFGLLLAQELVSLGRKSSDDSVMICLDLSEDSRVSGNRCVEESLMLCHE